MPGGGEGPVIRETVIRFDIDIAKAELSQKQLIAIQEQFQKEIENSESRVKKLLIELKKLSGGGFIPFGKEGEAAKINAEIGEVQEVARMARKHIADIGVALKESTVKAKDFSTTAEKGLTRAGQKAKQLGKDFLKAAEAAKVTQKEIAKIASVATKAEATARNKLAGFRSTPIYTTPLGGDITGREQQLGLAGLSGGAAVEAVGGKERLATLSEAWIQVERYMKAVFKAQPRFKAATANAREYIVSLNDLANVIVTVSHRMDGAKIAGLEISNVVPVMRELGMAFETLQTQGYKYLGTMREANKMQAIFAKTTERGVQDVQLLTAKQGKSGKELGEWVNITYKAIETSKGLQNIINRISRALETNRMQTELSRQEWGQLTGFIAEYIFRLEQGTRAQIKNAQAQIKSRLALAQSVGVGQARMIADASIAARSQAQVSSAYRLTASSIRNVSEARQNEIIDVRATVVKESGVTAALNKEAAARRVLDTQIDENVRSRRQEAAVPLPGAGRGGIPPIPPARRLTAGAGGGGEPPFRRTFEDSPLIGFRRELDLIRQGLKLAFQDKDIQRVENWRKSLNTLRAEFRLFSRESAQGMVAVRSEMGALQEFRLEPAAFVAFDNAIDSVGKSVDSVRSKFMQLGEMMPAQEIQQSFQRLSATIKNLEAAQKRGEISARQLFDSLKALEVEARASDKSMQTYSAALKRAFTGVRVENAEKFRKALLEINVELSRTQNTKKAIAGLMALKKEFGDNAARALQLDKAMQLLEKSEAGVVVKNLTNYLNDLKLRVKEGTFTWNEYLKVLQRFKVEATQASVAQGKQIAGQRELNALIRKERAGAEKAIKAEALKKQQKAVSDLQIKLKALLIEFQRAPQKVAPMIQELERLRAAFTGNATATNLINQALQTVNFGGFKAQLSQVRAEFNLGNISATQWREKLQSLRVAAGEAGPAFVLLASEIKAADTAARSAGLKRLNVDMDKLIASAASGAITQRQLVASLKALRPVAEADAAAMRKLEMAVAKASRGMGDMGVVVGGLGRLFKTAYHHALWMFSGALIFPLYNLPRDILEMTKTLDTAFTKLKTVLLLDPELQKDAAGLTKQFGELKEAVFVFAEYYGEEVPKVAETFFNVAQKYKKSADIILVSNAIMRLSLLDFTDDVEKTSIQLMSLIAQLELAPKAVDPFINKVIIAGNVVRAEAGEIMDAMTRSASMLSAVGADASTQISLIATSLEKTGASAQKVGTAWRTLGTRIGGGVEKAIKLLKEYDIEVFNNMQTANDFGKTIDSMRLKYQLMSDEMKVSFVAQVAGIRRLQTLIPILEDTDKTFARVTGSISGTNEELKKVADKASLEQIMTLERRMKSVSVAFQYFWYSVTGTNKFKIGVLRFLFKITEMLGWIKEHFGEIKKLSSLLIAYIGYAKIATMWTSRFAKSAAAAGIQTQIMNTRIGMFNRLSPVMQGRLAGLGGSLGAFGLQVSALMKRFVLLYAAMEAFNILSNRFSSEEQKRMRRFQMAAKFAERMEDMSKKKGVGLAKVTIGAGYELLKGSGFSKKEIEETIGYIDKLQEKHNIYREEFNSQLEFTQALRKKLDEEYEAEQAKKWEKESKLMEKRMGRLAETLEKAQLGATEALPKDLRDIQYFKDLDDATGKAGESIDSYKSKVSRLKQSISDLTKEHQNYVKSLDRERTYLQNLLDIYPGAIFGEKTLLDYKSRFISLFSAMDGGINSTIGTAQKLYNKLDDIAGLRLKMSKQATEIIRKSLEEENKAVSRGAQDKRREWAGEYGMSSSYAPRELFGRKMHKGYDYRVPQGTELKPIAPGKVTKAGKMGGYGNAVIYSIAPGASILLGHLSRVDVKAGQAITTETLLGLSGGKKGTPGAGESTGAHAHREFRLKGKAVREKEFWKSVSGTPFDPKVGKEAVDTSDKYEKALDKIESNLQDLGSTEAEVTAKVIELWDSVDEQMNKMVKMYQGYVAAIDAQYGNLTETQSEYNSWLLQSSKITLKEWYETQSKTYDNAINKIVDSYNRIMIERGRLDKTLDMKEISESFMRDPLAFQESLGKYIQYLNEQQQEILIMSKIVKTEEEKIQLEKSGEFIRIELDTAITRLKLGKVFYENKLKLEEDYRKRALEEEKNLHEARMRMDELQYERALLLARQRGDTESEYRLIGARHERLKGQTELRINLLKLAGLATANLVEKQQIENTILELQNGLISSGNTLLEENIALKTSEYERTTFLREQQYNAMRLWATEEEALTINLMEAQWKLEDAYQRLNISIEEMREMGRDVSPDSLLNHANIRELVSEIATLELELYKLDPAFEAIMRISKEAGKAMQDAMRDAIKGFVKGEKSFRDMFGDVVKAQSEAVKETIAESFSEAIMIKLSGGFDSFEKQMQDVSGAIFELFGLQAPDKRPVMEKIFDPANNAIRVISPTLNAGMDDLSGAFAKWGNFGKGMNMKLEIPGLTGKVFGAGAGVFEAGADFDFWGLGKGKSSNIPTTKGGSKRGAAYTMVGNVISDMVTSQMGGQAGPGTQMFGMLGGYMAAQGAIFGGLGAAAGPVGMIVGAIAGKAMDNAFGVGRGESRRQAISAAQGARGQEIEDMKTRYGDLGFKPEDAKRFADMVPAYLERSQRSFMGLSGTSRWLEGGEAVWAEINRQKTILKNMEDTVKGYNEAVEDSDRLIAMGTGRFDVFGEKLGSLQQQLQQITSSMEGGRVAFRLAGQGFTDYQNQLISLSEAAGMTLSPFIDMNNQFNTMTDRISMMQYWLDKMRVVGLGTTDTFRQLEEQLFALTQKKYWADIFSPIKEGEWLKTFALKTDQDLLQYYKDAVKKAFGYQGVMSENVVSELAQSIAPEVALLQTGQIEGTQAEETQYRADLLTALFNLTNKIDEQNLAEAAVESRTIGEAIQGTSKIEQNYNSFNVNAQNFFSTKTEMLNIAKEFLTMAKQQGWIKDDALNI